MTDDLRDPDKAVDFLRDNAPAYAKAKAERIYLEEFRKSKKALLMRLHADKRLGVQEREAYSDPEYQALLLAYQAAIETEESLRWLIVGAQTRVDVRRSKNAANRRTEGVTT